MSTNTNRFFLFSKHFVQFLFIVLFSCLKKHYFLVFLSFSISLFILFSFLSRLHFLSYLSLSLFCPVTFYLSSLLNSFFFHFFICLTFLDIEFVFLHVFFSRSHFHLCLLFYFSHATTYPNLQFSHNINNFEEPSSCNSFARRRPFLPGDRFE